MQVIFNRSGTPTIPNVLLDTIDVEHGYVEITFDDDNSHEYVEFESLYPYFNNGQIAETRCGDKFIIIGEKHNVKYFIKKRDCTLISTISISNIYMIIIKLIRNEAIFIYK